jgi:hypothetical protein
MILSAPGRAQLRPWVTKALIAAAAAALVATTLGVGVGVWKALRDRRPAPVRDAKPTEPIRLSPDALPERVAGKPVENSYLSSPLKPTDDDVRRLIERVQFDRWYGVYIRKRKIGFAREVLRKTARGEPGAYFSSFDLAMQAGFRDVSYEFEAGYYAGDAPFRLLGVKARSKSADGDVVREISFGAHEGKLTETVDGATRPARAVSATKDTLTGVFAQTIAGPEHLKFGDIATFPTFDPDLLKDDQTVVTVTGLAERRVDGVEQPVATLSLHTVSDNQGMTVNVARGGRVLDAKFEHISLRPEPRDVAVAVSEGFN